MKILLVGCGKMGSALLSGWAKESVKIIDPVLKKSGVYNSVKDLPKGYQPNIIVLAVKPQNLSDVLPPLEVFTKAIVISIIAGKTISYIKKFLPNATIIRTMPNLPVTVGSGVIAAFTNSKLSNKAKVIVMKIFAKSGKLVWLKDEKQIDAVTAISGSGPAYVFLFTQGLIDAAVKLGIDQKLARTLAIETVKGSIKLAEKSNESLNELKVNVTSKGGTTEAALKVFENGNSLKNLISEAAVKAKKRSEELSE